MDALDLAIGTLDFERGWLLLPDGKRRELTPQECGILEYLARRPHQDVPRDVLLTDVLGYAPGAMTRAVDDAMKRLRAKVERVPSRPFHLVAVRGVGYRFVPLEEASSPRSFRLGERLVDLDRLVVEEGGAEMATLSDHEGRLLEVLLAREGRPMPTLDLLREVWGIRDAGQRRVVDKLVYRLRAKLEEGGGAPRFLRTIRGRGLALVLQDAPPARSTPLGEPCPSPDGPVVGREALLEDIRAALEAPGALVTLHGPAGAGKSTVARVIALGWEGLARYANLEPTQGGPEAIGAALARAVGADASPDEPSRLHEALRGHEDLLLVLDHAEVALPVVRDLGQTIREAAPALRLLVTSRHPLGSSGERIVAVPPLPTEAAVELFVARASAAGVRLDADDARVQTIVEEVDRIPLALDLAAGRLRLLGIDGLVSRLDRPLQLLQDAGTHDGLRESIARTWEVLEPDDRIRLAACSLLGGAFAPEAAERVFAAVVDGPSLDALQRLVDFAVLKRTPDGRLAPFLGVSEFVSEMLGDDLQALGPTVRRAQLEWLASLSSTSLPFWGPPPDQVPALTAEVPGAVAALAEPGPPELHAQVLSWLAPLLALLGQGQQARMLLRRVGSPEIGPELGARLALLRLRGLSGVGGQLYDGIAAELLQQVREQGLVELEAIALGEWVRAAVDAGAHAELPGRRARLQELLADRPTPLAEAHLRAAEGWFAFRRGDLDAAWSDLQDSLTLARMAGATWHASRTTYNLAGVCRFEGRLAEAEAFLEQSRSPNERSRTPYTISDPDDMLGLIRVEQGRLAEARQLHEALLDRGRRTGNRVMCALQANRLGTVAGYIGDTDAAMRWFEESRAGFVALGVRARAEGARYNLGEVALQSGRLDDAEHSFREALDGFEELGWGVHAGVSLGGLGRVALARGDNEAAEPLLVAALSKVDAGRARRQAAELRSCLAQSRLGRDAGAVALARQAVDELLAVGSTPALGAAWCRWGLASLADGDEASAQEALRRARELQDDLPNATGGEFRQLVRALANAVATDQSA